MIQMHFGSSRRLVYGVYHPAGGRRLRRGVLLLNPYGWEALRAHRTLRTLALRLAAAGLDVLRFDYSCTGDSFGDREDASWDDWMEDADFALDELQSVAGLRKVSLVGLRMGALLAAALAEERPDVVDRQVLWAPPSDGADVVRWARTGHPGEVATFPIGSRLAGQLEQIDSSTLRTRQPTTLVLGLDPPGREADVFPGADLITLPADEPHCWLEDRDHGAGAVPAGLIARIVTWMTA